MREPQNKTKPFDLLTQKYKLSKTLRFELKPIGKTAEYLKKNKIIEKDKTIKKVTRRPNHILMKCIGV